MIQCPNCQKTWPDDYDASHCDCGHSIDQMPTVNAAAFFEACRKGDKKPRELSPYLKSLLKDWAKFRIPREITAFANQSGEVTYRIGVGFVAK